jgi:hypothetical protein
MEASFHAAHANNIHIRIYNAWTVLYIGQLANNVCIQLKREKLEAKQVQHIFQDR